MKFDEGAKVRLVYDIVNDGTIYGAARGEQVMSAGAVGYVVKYGIFLLDEIIYEVHFVEEGKIIGCREKELIDGDEPWAPPVFKKGDRVKAAIDLTLNGAVIVASGTEGAIGPVRRHPLYGYVYETRFDGAPNLVLALENQMAGI